jgi:hypothetical protein
MSYNFKSLTRPIAVAAMLSGCAIQGGAEDRAENIGETNQALTSYTGTVWGNPAAYVRSDHVNSIPDVRSQLTGDVMELYLDGTGWHWGDLTLLSGASAAGVGWPTGYVRGDGVNAVVYYGRDYHVHELHLSGTQWYDNDLTQLYGGPGNPNGDLAAYVRSDGASSVVYCSFNDYHIHEYYLLSGYSYWQERDLTLASGGAECYDSPVAYQRSDGINSVVFASYASPSHVWELYSSKPQSAWFAGDLSAISGTNVDTLSFTLTAHVRPNNVNSVVFQNYENNHIHEISLVPGQSWHHLDLTAQTGAPPASSRAFGYTRSDGVSSYVFADTSGWFGEITLSGSTWSYNLMGNFISARCAANFTAYRRSDNVNAVVYYDCNDHVIEASWYGSGPWYVNDLSSMFGEPIR